MRSLRTRNQAQHDEGKGERSAVRIGRDESVPCVTAALVPPPEPIRGDRGRRD
jgi:hypothetical protein